MRIAVTGANGTIGGDVAWLLAGSHDVVAVVRRPGTHPPDVTEVMADYDDLPALRRALAGVDVLVFVSSDGEAARIMIHHQNVVRAASETGVGHVVYLSGLDASVDSPFCYAYTNGYTERLLVDSGLTCSIARSSIFTEFFVQFASEEAGHALRLPADDARISLVSQADVARTLTALATAPPTGRMLDITGPQALDVHEIAGLIGRVRGTPTCYVPITADAFVTELTSAGEDPWWTYAYSTMFASIRMRRWAPVSNDVHRLTGRAPSSVADVLARC